VSAVETMRDIAYGRKSPPRWMWPAFLFVLGAGTLFVSLLFYPGGDEWTYLFGMRFGGECSIVQATGHPCPSCGMTRSWVHVARGQVLTSAMYNLAGTTLWMWLVFGGFLGGVRLVTRDYRKWQMPYRLVAGFGLFWMIALYMGVWVVRLFGMNPLPTP